MIFDAREDETCFRKCDCDRRAETIQARLEQRIVFYTAAEWLMWLNWVCCTRETTFIAVR